VWKADQKVHVSQKEFHILAFLMRHPNTPIPHAKLLQAVLGPRIPGELEYLRTYVRHLRKKIGQGPARPEYITEPFGWGIASGTSRIPTHPFCQNRACRSPIFMSFSWIW
jgi:DNA-binding response OmpR family regulator